MGFPAFILSVCLCTPSIVSGWTWPNSPLSRFATTQSSSAKEGSRGGVNVEANTRWRSVKSIWINFNLSSPINTHSRECRQLRTCNQGIRNQWIISPSVHSRDSLCPVNSFQDTLGTRTVILRGPLVDDIHESLLVGGLSTQSIQHRTSGRIELHPLLEFLLD
jgi:hypothetical protein